MARRRLVLVERDGEGRRSHDGEPPLNQRQSTENTTVILFLAKYSYKYDRCKAYCPPKRLQIKQLGMSMTQVTRCPIGPPARSKTKDR